MPKNEEYRDRLVHEFDENPQEYESAARQEVLESLQQVDDEEFVRSYSRLPSPSPEEDEERYRDRDIEDNEALEGYRHIAKGDWQKLSHGQVISLYRHLNTIQKRDAEEGAASQNAAYRELEKNIDELDYVLTQESELERTENRYIVDDK